MGRRNGSVRPQIPHPHPTTGPCSCLDEREKASLGTKHGGSRRERDPSRTGLEKRQASPLQKTDYEVLTRVALSLPCRRCVFSLLLLLFFFCFLLGGGFTFSSFSFFLLTTQNQEEAHSLARDIPFAHNVRVTLMQSSANASKCALLCWTWCQSLAIASLTLGSPAVC
ncbi:hypothetical protein B0T10DRAFT_178423 [Thelonectria olida]|uniref:Uncharacterized protein n=1 Tax=Thelonectria olida TaxID=1576542 RepID=A0A9P8WCM8_9HYPO|nr:hypothetical protein B0T10DRAFT_178423 [Thelonectria olida]